MDTASFAVLLGAKSGWATGRSAFKIVWRHWLSLLVHPEQMIF